MIIFQKFKMTKLITFIIKLYLTSNMDIIAINNKIIKLLTKLFKRE